MSIVLLLGLILFGILIFVIALYSYGFIEAQTAGNAKWVAEKLDLMFIPIPAKRLYPILMIGPFVAGVALFWLFSPFYAWGLLFGIATVILGFRLPRPIIQMLVKRRTRKLNVQMVDGLTLMANALRSGLSLMQALQLLVEEMPAPLSQEMNLILSEQRIGVPVEKAFQNFAERVNNEDIEMFVTAVVVLRETGGNLAETFDTIVHTIRERMKLENKIVAMTTQGVMQGTIVTLMPFALMLLLSLIDPSHMKPLFTTMPGYIMLALMLALQAIGGLMIKKIVTIKI